VIVCSLDETTMLVYPGGRAEPFEAPLDPPRLAAAIRERS
jgi:8-oxo-dGTP pyrophosphatase MutT (NUDIX family)